VFIIGILFFYSSLIRSLATILVFDAENQVPRSDCFHCTHAYCWKCLLPFSNYFLHVGNHTFSAHALLILDIFSTISLFLLLQTPYPLVYLGSYFFFFSALLVTLYTDIQHMLISRFVTLYSIPLVFILTLLNALPISPFSSIIGALSGFMVLYAIALSFSLLTKKEGLGQGDIDLIAFIGSCIGFLGWWTTLLIGSFTASIYGVAFMLAVRQMKSVKLPFGPFLILGAILYVLMQHTILSVLFTP